jgi:hypothetical protein
MAMAIMAVHCLMPHQNSMDRASEQTRRQHVEMMDRLQISDDRVWMCPNF